MSILGWRRASLLLRDGMHPIRDTGRTSSPNTNGIQRASPAGWATVYHVGGEISRDIDFIVAPEVRDKARPVVNELSRSHHQKWRDEVDGVHLAIYIPHESELGRELRLRVEVLARYTDPLGHGEWRLLLPRAYDLNPRRKVPAHLRLHFEDVPSEDMTLLEGLPVVTPVRAIVDSIGGATRADLVQQAIDTLTARGCSAVLRSVASLQLASRAVPRESRFETDCSVGQVLVADYQRPFIEGPPASERRDARRPSRTPVPLLYQGSPRWGRAHFTVTHSR